MTKARGVMLVLVLVISSFVGGASVTLASHLFNDVPTTAIYHNATEWLYNRAITLGCGGGNFCPDDNVTRWQMALFLQRQGAALSPKYVQANANTGAAGGAFDLDVVNYFCPTVDHTPTYPQVAHINAWVSLGAEGGAGDLGFYIRVAYSTNGGASWIDTGTLFPRGGVSAGEWGQAMDMHSLNLTPGTSYRFSVRPVRESGTQDPTAGRCEVLVEINNRNPTTSPY